MTYTVRSAWNFQFLSWKWVYNPEMIYLSLKGIKLSFQLWILDSETGFIQDLCYSSRFIVFKEAWRLLKSCLANQEIPDYAVCMTERQADRDLKIACITYFSFSCAQNAHCSRIVQFNNHLCSKVKGTEWKILCKKQLNYCQDFCPTSIFTDL